MSEYWKSTPKYWCKFCKTYVRDTPLEKKQHESTGRHQGAIQKSLRDLHKTQGREERDKQRAKDEVARLNGLVPAAEAAKAGPSGSAQSVAKSKPHFTRTGPAQSTAEDRRRQAEQLAAMGIAVPDEFRKGLSIAGEWSTVSSKVVYIRPQSEFKDEFKDENEDEDDKESHSIFGNTKRKLDDDTEAPVRNKRTWGSTLKSYPGARGGDADDFDALLSTKATEPAVKPETEELEGGVILKKEEPVEQAESAIPGDGATASSDAPVVFKKRKAKR